MTDVETVRAWMLWAAEAVETYGKTGIEEPLSALDRIARKVEAYDRARAHVKIEGATRAEYVLRAESAEVRLSEAERAIPATFYAHMLLPDRIRLMVDGWRKAIDIVNDLERKESDG